MAVTVLAPTGVRSDDDVNDYDNNYYNGGDDDATTVFPSVFSSAPQWSYDNTE